MMQEMTVSMRPSGSRRGGCSAVALYVSSESHMARRRSWAAPNSRQEAKILAPSLIRPVATTPRPREVAQHLLE
jgi:hypothetical protein